MKKGEPIDTFLGGLNEILDKLTAIEATPDQVLMVRMALNSISGEWQVFVQSILGREKLSNWEGMWAALQQEEMRQDLVKCKLDSSSSSGTKPKEEEENATLASKGQQE